jgi:hypothetical protein
VRKTILGGIAVTATLGAMLASGASAGPSAGKPTTFTDLLCGVGNAPTVTPDGTSSESRFTNASFAVSEQTPGQACDWSKTADGTWTILHGNVDTTEGSERGTEHGQYALASQSGRQGGFNGHVTDFDFGSEPCPDGHRNVYYESGTEHDSACPPDFGPVGNFNTHGGAATGDHSRGTYGTLIYQTHEVLGSPCDDTFVAPGSSPMYCIEVNLTGQIN